MGLNALYTLTRSNYPSFCTGKTIWARSKLTLVLSAFGSFTAMLTESIAAKSLADTARLKRAGVLPSPIELATFLLRGEAGEVQCPEAFCETDSLVPECPSVPF